MIYTIFDTPSIIYFQRMQSIGDLLLKVLVKMTTSFTIISIDQGKVNFGMRASMYSNVGHPILSTGVPWKFQVEIPQKTYKGEFIHVISFWFSHLQKPIFRVEDKTHDQLRSRNVTEIETLRISGHFKEKLKCNHVNKFSFACFLGHSKVFPLPMACHENFMKISWWNGTILWGMNFPRNRT